MISRFKNCKGCQRRKERILKFYEQMKKALSGQTEGSSERAGVITEDQTPTQPERKSPYAQR